LQETPVTAEASGEDAAEGAADRYQRDATSIERNARSTA
jgi:hypothetical protein